MVAAAKHTKRHQRVASGKKTRTGQARKDRRKTKQQLGEAKNRIPASQPKPPTDEAVAQEGPDRDEEREEAEIASTQANSAKATAAATAAASNLDLSQDDVIKLFDLRQKAYEAEQALVTKTEERKAAAKRADAAAKAVFEFLDEFKSPRPLIAYGERMAAKNGSNGNAAKPAVASTGEVTPVDESWRQDKIEDVLKGKGAGYITEHVCGLLHESNIHTMGDLADWTNPAKHGGRQRLITDIKGLKGKRAESLEDATTRYFAEMKDRQDAAAAAQSSGGAAPEASTTAAEHPDDAWRQIPVANALQGLRARIIGKLNAANIHNMGQLHDAGNLTKVKGIGKAVAHKIGEAQASWWERQAQQSDPGDSATPPPAGEKVPCPHCKAEIDANTVLSCPSPDCDRQGCANCMPGGPESACPDCEAKKVEGPEGNE